MYFWYLLNSKIDEDEKGFIIVSDVIAWFCIACNGTAGKTKFTLGGYLF